MASLANDPGGKKRILFIDGVGKRKSIRLGKMSKRQAETVKHHIEDLLAAKLSGSTPSDKTSHWLTGIEDPLRNKLADHGLAERRESARLGNFIAAYLEKRVGVVKASTLLVDRLAENSLVGFFGADQALRRITEGDAEDFRNHLLSKGMAEATVRKRCSIAGKMFRNAVRHGLIEKNPFEAVPTNSVATDKFSFVSEADAQKVLKELPDCQWKLLFALSRWGGLRVGSEVRRLTWDDINWEGERFTVHSPKTEHIQCRGTRTVPIFPELAKLLTERYTEAEEGDTLVLPMLVGKTDTALRNTLQRAIKRAGLKPWPRPWHNMRATRQTELADRFAGHVVCDWMGNNEHTATKHYLRVREAHFFEAAQNPAQSTRAAERSEAQKPKGESKKASEKQACAPVRKTERTRSIVREGLEPPTKGL